MTQISLNGSAGPLLIDGFVPGRLERPENAQQLAAFLAEAAHANLAVAPVGGHTKPGYGNLPRRLDAAVSTRALNQILSYQPTDLTLSTEAGATLAEIQAELGAHGQWLPIDAAYPEKATIGGLIATALAGPRRLGSETLRDLLIGISVAHPDGVVSKAGGLVVKNVSGFDMMRLYLGSLGTLGVIVSANFKTLPRPRTERTLLANGANADVLMALARQLLQSRARPVALEIEQLAADRWQLAARIEGRPGAVGIMTDEARKMAGTTDLAMLDDAESAAWWQHYVDRQSVGGQADPATVRFNTRPRETGDALKRISEETDAVQAGTLAVSPGLGEIRLRFSSGAADAATIHRIRQQSSAFAEHSMLITSDPQLKRGSDVWGQEPATIDVMRSLKMQFDPTDLLNPGRFAGFI